MLTTTHIIMIGLGLGQLITVLVGLWIMTIFSSLEKAMSRLDRTVTRLDKVAHIRMTKIDFELNKDIDKHETELKGYRNLPQKAIDIDKRIENIEQYYRDK